MIIQAWVCSVPYHCWTSDQNHWQTTHNQNKSPAQQIQNKDSILLLFLENSTSINSNTWHPQPLDKSKIHLIIFKKGTNLSKLTDVWFYLLNKWWCVWYQCYSRCPLNMADLYGSLYTGCCSLPCFHWPEFTIVAN